MQGNLTIERDFPRTYREFVERFPSDAACAAYLEQLRWPMEFSCPACGVSGAPWRQTLGRPVCPACRHQTSVTAGTTLERTLGTSYRTAWALLQRYRVAMVRSERERLAGAVEVDETLVGGVEQGDKCGRGTSKAVVVIAVEVKEPKGFGRLRMRHVPDASGASLQPFVGDVIAQGATVRTDGWTGYNGLLTHEYLHERTALSSSSDPAHVSMPGVHRVAALLKRWILSTHQGSVTSAHLQSYLEEFTFRFNRRSSDSCGLVFRRLIAQAVVAGPLTEAELTFGYDWSRSQGRRR